MESFVENKSLYIIMEYADGGDLHSLIENKKRYTRKRNSILSNADFNNFVLSIVCDFHALRTCEMD